MPRQVTLAVNTLPISDANDGIATMARRLFPALRALAPEINQLLICTPANRHLFEHDGEAIEIDLDHAKVLRRIWNDQATVPRLVRSRADVLVTVAGTPPLRPTIPQITIVAHHFALPSCQATVPEADGSPNLAHRIYLGAPFRRGLRVSSKVLGISEYMAHGLVAELGIDEAKVAAMPLGVDSASGPISLEGREPMLLFVSALYPYKGAATAVDAFAMARPGLPTGARLVIVGRDTAWQQGSSIRAQAERLGCADAVELLGRVEDAELERLYRSASAFVLPSLLEGFGLPVAEAMSRGTPVVVADATALPEVVGDAGLLVPPGDVAALADAFTTLLCDEARRLDLARRGVARAAELTWEASAAVLRDAVHAAASR